MKENSKGGGRGEGWGNRRRKRLKKRKRSTSKEGITEAKTAEDGQKGHHGNAWGGLDSNWRKKGWFRAGGGENYP